MAVMQLAAAYCDALVEDTSLRSQLFIDVTDGTTVFRIGMNKGARPESIDMASDCGFLLTGQFFNPVSSVNDGLIIKTSATGMLPANLPGYMGTSDATGGSTLANTSGTVSALSANRIVTTGTKTVPGSATFNQTTFGGQITP